MDFFLRRIPIVSVHHAKIKVILFFFVSRNHPIHLVLKFLELFSVLLDFTKAKRQRRLLFIFWLFLSFRVVENNYNRSYRDFVSDRHSVSVLKKKKLRDPARIRTWNPLIRSQMPYPLGHGASLKGTCYYILLIQGKGYQPKTKMKNAYHRKIKLKDAYPKTRIFRHYPIRTVFSPTQLICILSSSVSCTYWSKKFLGQV